MGSRWASALRAAVIVVVCGALGLLCLGLVMMMEYPDLDQLSPRDEVPVMLRLLADLALGVLALCLLPWALGRSGRLAGIVGLLVIALTPWSALAMPAAFVALVVLAGRSRGWVIAGALTALAAVVVADVFDSEPFDPVVIVLAGLLAVALPIGIGQWLEHRRALTEQYRLAAESAQREQVALVASTRAQERTTIAREMHDTLSHRLSLISLHAGGLAYHPTRPAAQVADSARLIQQTAQAASEELHALLTLLREDQHDTSLAPEAAPFEAIVDAFRQQGVEVRTTVDPTTRSRLDTLPALASRALATCLREGLANAAKHAPGRPVDVELAEDDGVRLTLSNPLSHERTPLAGGHGLVGLEERVAVAGGSLEAAPRGDRFVLTAWVPWT